MADTRYEIALDYRLQGVEKGLAATKGLASESDKLARSLQWVKRAAIAVGASFVFGKVKSALIDSNRELESMQIGMSAVLGMSLSMPFEKAEPVAARLVEHYRQIAKVSPGTTKDFLEFNNAISGAVLNAGGSLGDLKRITAGGVIGGQAFGFRADVAAKDVQQALTGNVTMQTPFIKMLLGNESDIAKFNAMTGPARVAKLREILEGPALKKAAEKFGQSYEGQLSTLKDTASNTFRAIGAPLFKQLTSWLTQINAWADRNGARLTAIAHSIGEGITTGARWLLKAGMFIVDNAKTIAMVAGVGLLAKGGAGLLSIGGASPATALAKLASSANLAAIAIGAMAIGLPIAFKQLDRVFGDVRGWAMEVAGPGLKPTIDLGERGRAIGRQATNQLDLMAKVRDIGQMARDNLLMKHDAVKPRNPKVNVTIKRVEVVADDADRFIHSLNRAVGKELASPSQSVFMPRGNV